MGLFDSIHCHVPLPFPEELDRALVATLQAGSWQTKDLNCFMDVYEVSRDGTLHIEVYDVEDRSDPNATGIMRIAGMLTRVNTRWRHATEVTGHVFFYESIGRERSGWVEMKATFVDGKLDRPIALHEYRPIDPVEEEKRTKDREEWMREMRERPEMPGAGEGGLP